MSVPVHIGTATGATSPQAIDLTAGAAIGTRVVVGVVNVSGGVMSIADSKANTWTLLAFRTVPTTPGNMALYETIVTNTILDTDTITVTVAGAPTAVTAVAVKVTDTLAASPRDRYGITESQGAITVWDSGLGVSCDDFVALAFVVNQAARTNTATAPWTELTETAGTASRPIAVCYIDSSNTFQKFGSPGTLSGSGTNVVAMGVVYRKSGATDAVPHAVDDNGAQWEAIEVAFAVEGTPVPIEGQLWPRGSF